MAHEPPPKHLEVRPDEGLLIEWADGTRSTLSAATLRRNSPSAEARALRESLASNPLTVLPASAVSNGPLRAVDAELIGNYALRITFSDGHSTGLFSWTHLRSLASAAQDQ
jgi:DUF971 family protein